MNQNNSETLIIEKKDEVYLTLDAEPSILQEISGFFTFYVPGYKFIPSYRNKIWDGKIRLLNTRNNTIYCGLIDYIETFAEKRNYTVEYESDIKSQNEFSILEGREFIKSLNLALEPRDYQISAFVHSIRKNRCLLLSPTASGKSLIIYFLVRFYNVKTLILVPTTSLVSQMYTDFIDYAKQDEWSAENTCHTIFAGRDKVSTKHILISTWQSLYKMSYEYFDEFDLIIGDEAHLYKAKSLTSILTKLVSCPYRFGLTGTLDGTLTHKLVLEGLFGAVKKITTTKELIDRNYLSPFHVKAIVLKYTEPVCKALNRAKYQEELNFLVSNDARNRFIRNLAISLEGNTLLLFQFVEKHGRILYNLIKEKVTNRTIFFVYGGTDADAREQVRSITEKKRDAIIIASYGVYSTGVNIRNLHNIIFSSPSKSRIRNLQSIGRTLRKTKDKKTAILYDIADDLSYKNWRNYTLGHYIERIKIYNDEKFDYKIYTVKLKK